jgi:hypothetical protein
MKTGVLMGAVVAVAALVGLLGQSRPDQARPDPAPVDPVAEPRTGAMGDPFDLDEPGSEGEASALRGRVRERIDVAEYTYLRLATAQGEVWAAVTKTSVAVDDEVAIENPTQMQNFESTTLKRTFDVIYFGTLGSGATATGDALPPGHPSIEGANGSPHAHGAPTAGAETAQVPDVKVSRAAGKNARSIAELFTDGSKLAGTLLRVRGQVVKVTPGVLGKTYVRLRDGSSARPDERELVVTTTAEPRVGDVSTFEGTLRTQVDVGIGYKYPLLLDSANLIADPTAKAL